MPDTSFFGWRNDYSQDYLQEKQEPHETVYCIACDFDVLYEGDEPDVCPYCGVPFETVDVP